jgi:hypothetical protein
VPWVGRFSGCCGGSGGFELVSIGVAWCGVCDLW